MAGSVAPRSGQLKEGRQASCKIDGFVDYSEVAAQGSNQLADHASVLMFRATAQSLGATSSKLCDKGSTPGKVLAELVLSAIILKLPKNVSVLVVISDGAANNNSMWSQFGVSGKPDAPHHFIEHPWEPSQNIYFLCGVPHIVTCIRNHLRKHTYGMVEKACVNGWHS